MNRLIFFLLLLPVFAFGQGTTRTYDTVAQMTNQPPEIISTSGKVTVDVRGTSGLPGGVFYWDSASVESVDEQTYFPALGIGRWIRASYWIPNTNSIGGGGGGSTVYVAGNLFTNINLLEGANVSFGIVDTNVTINGITSTNSGSVVTVDGGSPLVIANFADSPEVNQTITGSNVTATLVNGSITTNRIDSTFYTLLTAGGSTGSVVRVNAGAAIPDASFDTSSFISFAESGGSITASVVNGSISTNKLDSTVYNLLISGGGTGSVVRVNAGSSIPDASFDSSSFILFNNSAGSITATVANASLTTNLINSTFYNLLVGGGGTGTVVSVNGGPALPVASFDSSSFITFAESGGSVTATVATASLTTNQINSVFYNLLTAPGTSYSFTNGVTNTGTVVSADLAAGSNITFATNNGKITIASSGGGGGGGLGIFVAGTPVTNANAISSVNATVSSSSVSNFTFTFTGVGSATNGYLLKSATILTNLGSSGETDVWNFNLPADTLSEDGDELEFFTSGHFLNDSGSTGGYQWRFYGEGGELITGSLLDNFPDLSSDRAVEWTCRLRRISNTRGYLTVLHVADAQSATELDTNSWVQIRHAVAFDVVGFDGPITFQFTVQNSASHGSLGNTLFGYTVHKIATGGEGGASGSSTRTGIARTINWPANSFTPALTEPASAYTNTWATSTDRYAQECWKFSATTTNGIRSDFIWPNTYSNATPVNVRFWMKQLTAEATSTNAFSISVGSQGSGDTGGALLGTAVEVLVVGANNTNQLTQSSWTSAITVGNTAAAGDKGIISIRRHPGNTSDNGSVEVVVTDIELEYLEHNVEPANN